MGQSKRKINTYKMCWQRDVVGQIHCLCQNTKYEHPPIGIGGTYKMWWQGDVVVEYRKKRVMCCL